MKKNIKKRIQAAIGGLVLIGLSIIAFPYCDGDITYLLATIPLGLFGIFGGKYLDM